MTILVSRPEPSIAQVLLDRPSVRNAINLEMVNDLVKVLDGRDRVVVLGSTSTEAFSAGVDLKLPEAERSKVSQELYGLYEQMLKTDSIVIAALAGYAIGGGAQLALASDFRVASPDTTFTFRGPGHGLAVGAWGLPGLLGRGRALDLALTMRSVGADEALAIGLIERIDESPLPSALRLARHITGLSPAAVIAVKRIISIGDPYQALKAEADHNRSWDGSISDGSQGGSQVAR
jgi:enoyl-CoA hydratase/carnithine racemase